MISYLTQGGPGRVWATGRWRLIVLYTRGRGVLPALALVIAAIALVPLLRQWASFNAAGSWGDAERLKQFAVVQVVPALVAAVIGVAAWSPLGETERTSVSALPWLRALHLCGLTGVALLGGWVAFRAWDSRSAGVDLSLVAARNTIGFTGMALLACRAIDPRLSWLAPLSWTAVALAGAMVTPSDRLWMNPVWQWSGLASGSVVGVVIAVVLGTVGLWIGIALGGRDALAEAGE